MANAYVGMGYWYPKASELQSDGIPSLSTFTPFWDASFRSAALLGTGSFEASSLVYRSRSPDPTALVTSYLAGFKLDDRSMPLGRLPKRNATPLETEIVNAVAVCYVPSLISDSPVVLSSQPACCACCDMLPRDPDPYSILPPESKSVAALTSAKNRTVTVLEQLVPRDSLCELEEAKTPLLVLPTGAAHSGIEIVALSYALEDVAFLEKQKLKQRSFGIPAGDESHTKKTARGDSRETCTDGCNEDGIPEKGDFYSHSPRWKHNMRVASCSLGIEGRFLAEMHPQAFQWTQGTGERIRSNSFRRCAGRGIRSSSCCHRCCLCPMGREVDLNGSVRNIHDRPDARHASHPLDTIVAKESLISDRILEIRVDDKHPFIKLIMARNSRGIYAARLRLTEEDANENEAHEAVLAALANRRGRTSPETSLSGHMEHVVDGFSDGAIVRRLHIDVLHDARYGSTVPGGKTVSGVQMPCSEGPPRFALPKKNPGYPTVLNIAVSPTSVGEFALLYSSQVVSLWTAGEARMEISDVISLSDSTKTMRRSVGSTLLWGHRATLADSSRENFQTLCYANHACKTILLGSDHIWAKDMREVAIGAEHWGVIVIQAPELVRLFPALQPPTHSSRLHRLAETFYAPCPTHSSFHTCFTALAPHPTQPFLLAAAHGATEAVFLFDARAMHQPLTVVDLPSCRKTGARYRSLLWHSSKANWAQESEIQQMHATYLCGARARAAASSTATPVKSGATHDLLAAFSWRNEDVVCSAFTVHAAFCPSSDRKANKGDAVNALGGNHNMTCSNGAATECTMRSGNRFSIPACEQSSEVCNGDNNSRDVQSSSSLESSALTVVQSGCLPAVIQREVVEVSWQAEICMFPRIAWGSENKSRSCKIPSETPLGAEGLQIPPLRVTMDEHAVSGVFHGYAGACLINLPLKKRDCTEILSESCLPLLRAPRCRMCSDGGTHVGSKELHSKKDRECCSCSKVNCSVERTPSDEDSYISVIGVLTTSGRLFCRPLTMRNCNLKCYSMHETLRDAQRDKLFRRAVGSGVAHDKAIAPLEESSDPEETKRTLDGNSLFSVAKACDSSEVRSLVRLLQSTSAEVCVVPQKVISLMLEVDLVQKLQRQMALQAAIRWKCSRLQLQAQLSQCSSAEHSIRNSRQTALQYVKRCVSTFFMSRSWNFSLPSFNFCDSGSLALHKPAFLLEYYEPEPVIQMLLTNSSLLQDFSEGSGFSSIHLASRSSVRQGRVQDKEIDVPLLDKINAPSGTRPSVSIADASTLRNYSDEDSEELPQHLQASSCGSIGSITSMSCREQLEAVLSVQASPASVSPLLEISAIPFRTVREKGAFIYMVQALHSLACLRPEECVRRLLHASKNSTSVLLHDILIAVELGRKGMLEPNEVIKLLQPFTICRPCTTGHLYVPRTTVNHDVLPTPSTIRPDRLSAGGNFVSEDNLMPQKHTEFVKVSNPAVLATLQCCCRLLVQHQYELHAHSAADDFNSTLGENYTAYCHTDNVHALLSLLEKQEWKWLLASRTGCNVPSRRAWLLPQALVDDLAETLFLTHEFLLLPEGANALSEGIVWDSKGYRGSKKCCVCPLASPWLPSYCLTRHLHAFYSGSQLLLEGENVQDALKSGICMHSKEVRVCPASRGCSADRISETCSGQSVHLPDVMQLTIPHHMSDAFNTSMWSRLAAGVAVNYATIAGILQQWECSALERLKREGEGRNATVESREPSAVPNFDFAAPGQCVVQDQPSVDTPERIRTELSRILKLLPDQAEASLMLFRPQEGRQSQQNVLSERQQLLEQIARYLEAPR